MENSKLHASLDLFVLQEETERILKKLNESESVCESLQLSFAFNDKSNTYSSDSSLIFDDSPPQETYMELLKDQRTIVIFFD